MIYRYRFYRHDQLFSASGPFISVRREIHQEKQPMQLTNHEIAHYASKIGATSVDEDRVEDD